MPSASYTKWLGERMKKLGEIRAAHAAIGGTGPGRRTATQQINQAYAVLVLAHFQGFCRDLHSEAIDHLSTAVRPAALAPVLRINLTESRALDKGNANAANIEADFRRFDMSFWAEVSAYDSRTPRRRNKLDELTRWRNAIGHQDFTRPSVGGRSLTLDMVESWFSACHGLAGSFDAVVGLRLAALSGVRSW